MKINKTTLFLTALMLTAATQPALGMNGLQNNPYVKYGAAIVTGFTLGSGLMYYLTSKNVELAKPETKETESQTGDVKGIEKETQTDVVLDIAEKMIQLRFKRNKSQFTESVYCSQSDLNTLKKTKTCLFENIGQRELKIFCLQPGKPIVLHANPKTIERNDQGYTVSRMAFILKDYERMWEPYCVYESIVNLDGDCLKITLLQE